MVENSRFAKTGSGRSNARTIPRRNPGRFAFEINMCIYVYAKQGVAILSLDPSQLDFSRERLLAVRGPLIGGAQKEEKALKLASAAGVAAAVLTMVAQL